MTSAVCDVMPHFCWPSSLILACHLHPSAPGPPPSAFILHPSSFILALPCTEFRDQHAYPHAEDHPSEGLHAAGVPGFHRGAGRGRPRGRRAGEGNARCFAQSADRRIEGAARTSRRRAGTDIGHFERQAARQHRIHTGYRTSDDCRRAGPVDAGNRGTHRAQAELQIDGPVRFQGRPLQPVRSGRLPPHNLLPRPAGRDGALHHHHPCRPHGIPLAPVQRQPGRSGRRSSPHPGKLCLKRRRGRKTSTARSTALGTVGGPVPEALVSVRDGGGKARQARGQFRHQVRAQGEAFCFRRAGQA